jgi:hypothetical protein
MRQQRRRGLVLSSAIDIRVTQAQAVRSTVIAIDNVLGRKAAMLSAFRAQPIYELKQQDKSKIESVLAYGKLTVETWKDRY